MKYLTREEFEKENIFGLGIPMKALPNILQEILI